MEISEGVVRIDPSFLQEVNRRSGQLVQLCYLCQKCTAGCPTAHAMDYRPAQMLRLIQFGMRDSLFRSAGLWRCLACETCGARCPNGISIMRVVEALREMMREEGYLAQERLALLGDRSLVEGVRALDRLGETITTTHNISGDDNALRSIWSQNLEEAPEGLVRKRGAEVVYFVGCVGSFYPRSYRIPQAFVSTLVAAGIDFTTLGGEEWCCGYPLKVAGLSDEAQALVHHNIERVKEIGARRVVCTCPACYYTWSHLYRDVAKEAMADLEVLHASEFLSQLVGGGRLSLGSLPEAVTYHDPCDLGRKSGIFEPPRRVLGSIPDLTLVEMADYGENALCCGGGGNMETLDASLVGEVASKRLAEVQETGAGIVVSACAQCERTLGNAIRADEESRRRRIRVMDLVELVWQAVKRG